MTPEEQQKELEDVLINNPKSFVSGTRIYISDEYFALRIDVGTQQFNFALPPRLAKILAYFLSEQIKSFESRVRKIDAILPAPTATDMNDLVKFGFNTERIPDSSSQQEGETKES